MKPTYNITNTILLPVGKKVYFASDQHFGAPTRDKSKVREAVFVDWLNQIQSDASHLFLLGDLFDFWFEYQQVVPKGFVRVLGKLATLSDSGVKIYFFTGNHDMWMKDYLQQEFNITIFHEPQHFVINNKHFLIGHGDGLGPGDRSYKIMKRIFRNKLSQWLFAWLHPDIGMRLGQYFSVENKLISGEEDVKFLGEDREMLIQYCKEIQQLQPFDFYLFGHRHLPMKISISTSAYYLNSGDWLRYNSYLTFHGNDVNLNYYNTTENHAES